MRDCVVEILLYIHPTSSPTYTLQQTQSIMASNATDVEGLALTSNLPDTVPDLLETVASHGRDLLAQDPEARLKLLEAVRSLAYALETPREAIVRHCWSEVCCNCHNVPPRRA